MQSDIPLARSEDEPTLIARLGLDPAVFALLVDKAQLLAAHGKYAAAEALLVDLCDLAGDSASIACLLGDCRLRQGDLHGARHAFTEAIERSNVLSSDRTVQLAHLARGRTWLEAGEPEEARPDFIIAAEGDDESLARFARIALEEISKGAA